MKRSFRPLIKLIVLILSLAAIVLLTIKNNQRLGLDEGHFMYAMVDGIRINVHESDGKYYLFLPSFAQVEDIEYSIEAKKHDITVLKSENLPGIFVTTKSGSLDNVLADKEYREPGSITVMSSDGDIDTVCGLDYIKGRGNYSWNSWEKKPFKLKLSKNASVLGLGLGKDYCLLANASDATLVRNEIGRKLEMAVGIPYASAGEFADLFVNGDYMGNYYFCPSIEVGGDRINITDIDLQQSKMLSRLNSDAFTVYETESVKGWELPETVDDITGGYLVEREFIDRYNLERDKIKNGFITERGEHFVVVSPEYCTVNEINYISGWFEKVEDEIFSGGELSEYIDAGSFAKRYLVEEVIKNYDGGVSSTYYFKDSDAVDGLVYAGPGWDFDMSLGNYLDWMEHASEDATGITELYLSEHSSIYFRELVKNPVFAENVRSCFSQKALPYIRGLLSAGIDRYEKELSASAKMDSIRWKEMYTENGYTTADHEEYEELKRFIRDRIEFLEGEWSD